MELLRDYQSNLQSKRKRNNTLTTHGTLNYFYPNSLLAFVGLFVDFNYERLRRDKSLFCRMTQRMAMERNLNLVSCLAHSSRK